MKIRNGFVSNSSSSSFIIRGLDEDQSDELARVFGNNKPWSSENGNIYCLEDVRFIKDVIVGDISNHAHEEFFDALGKVGIDSNRVEWEDN